MSNEAIKSKAQIRAEKLLPGNQDFTSITNDIAGVQNKKRHQYNGGYCLVLHYHFWLSLPEA